MSEPKPWSPLYQWNNDWCQASLYTDDTLELRSGSGIFARLTAQETADFLKWIDERPTRPASPALDRLKELKELVEGAPHGTACSLFAELDDDFTYHSPKPPHCSCWQSRALRIIEELKQ